MEFDYANTPAPHMLTDRNGPARTAQLEAEMNAAFQSVAEWLFNFHCELRMSSAAGSGDSLRRPATAMALFNQVYSVAQAHPDVAAEFVERLRNWSTDVLMPEYKATLDAALATGDAFWSALVDNSTSFLSVTKVTSAIFHNACDLLAALPRAPVAEKVLFAAFRDHILVPFLPEIQAGFFERMGQMRKQSDTSRLLTELRPVADIFANVARSDSSTMDENAARVYQKYFVNGYVNRLVQDNEALLREQQVRNVPANEIAKWINARAAFEETLLQSLVAPENALHSFIMCRFDEDVVAPVALELLQDNNHGFASTFAAHFEASAAGKTPPGVVCSSVAGLLQVAARAQRAFPKCVQVCAAAFRAALPALLERVSEMRRQSGASALDDLRPIANIFADAVRAASPSATLGESGALGRIYQEGFVDGYLERLVEDNTAAVLAQQASNVPAHEIAKWLNDRAAFEATLLQSLVAPENNLHNAIMLRYDDDVVATCTVELVRDDSNGFASSLRRGDQREESFRAAIDLFEISARVERKHPQCVEECVKEFRVGCTDRLRKLIGEARAAVFESSNAHAEAFVKQVLEEYHLMERILKRMRNHVSLVKANAECYKFVLNSEHDDLVIIRKVKRGGSGDAVDERKVMFCEVLATFVDLFLSNEQASTLDEAQQQATMADIGVLFSFIADRDIFGEHYKLRLAKRLLQTKFTEDLELQVLVQLQKQAGKHFISKFEGMINDVRVAGRLQSDFFDSQPMLPCEFEVKVLTMSFWPQFRPDDRFVPPPALVECQQAFQRFYRRRNPLKELHWRAERSMATLSVAYPTGTRELTMSVHQAAVMMAVDAVAPTMDGRKGVAVSEIANRCGMAVKDVLPALASMVFVKGLQLLRRTNVAAQAAKLEEGNSFEMNPDFSTKMRKLKLPTVSIQGSEPEPAQIDPIIEASRAQMLDAVIVRIMKARKTMTLNEIVEHCLGSVLQSFTAQPKMVKRRVEELIYKEYLRRSPDQPDVLQFRA